MTKLNDKKIRWIIRWRSKGMEAREVAIAQKVSVRRIEQLYREYKHTGMIPVLKTDRRPKKDFTEEEKRSIEKAYEETFLCAKLLRHHIRVHHGMDINHNRIHKHLLNIRKAEEDPKKKKKRTRCRYERDHSFSLVHGDWFEWEGRQVTGFTDDASRDILAIGEFDEATGESTIKVFKLAEKRAEELNSHIREANTDRGSQFYANKWSRKGVKGMSEFERYLDMRGITHIPSRRKNPQTNGKFERLVQEYRKHRGKFGSAEEFRIWYNNRMHGSLKLEWAETPDQALARKLRPESMLGLFFRNVVKEA
jgi:putative transposase